MLQILIRSNQLSDKMSMIIIIVEITHNVIDRVGIDIKERLFYTHLLI